MGINLKALIGKLNDPSRAALEGAAGLCLSRTNYDVEVEHYLTKLLDSPAGDFAAIAAILIASGEVTSSILSQPFATFGNGLSLTGLTSNGITVSAVGTSHRLVRAASVSHWASGRTRRGTGGATCLRGSEGTRKRSPTRLPGTPLPL